MPLINCKNKRNTCGTPYPSTCVSYEGSFVGILDQDDFECNVNLDDVLEKLSVSLKTLQDELGTLQTQYSTLSSSITTIDNQITAIQSSLYDPSQIYVNIDLGCLTSDASPCENGTKRYSLISLLQLFKNEICLLKS